MTAYIVFTRESTSDQAELDAYSQTVAPTFEGHPLKVLAAYGAQEVLEGLAKLRMETGCYLAALMATDNTKLESMLFIDAESDFFSYVTFPSPQKGIYLLKDVLSRKKQLMPALFEMVERASER